MGALRVLFWDAVPMANVNSPFGLRPYAYQSGAPYNGSVRVYYVPSSYASAIYVGDPVTTVTATADANGVPAVTLATAGASSYFLGPMVGIANNAGPLVLPLLQSSPVYLPASTGGYVYVADDPFLLYEMQENSSPSALAATSASRNVTMNAGSGGSTLTGLSSWQIDSNTLGTTSNQLRLIQVLQETGNAPGTNAVWLVKNLLPQLNNTTGT
jgi:hypothetical protein